MLLNYGDFGIILCTVDYLFWILIFFYDGNKMSFLLHVLKVSMTPRT